MFRHHPLKLDTSQNWKFPQISSIIILKSLSEVIPSTIEEYGRTVWAQLINNLVGVLQTDIYSQVNVGFEGLREVFYGEKCQKYISDSIMKQLTKELSKIKGINQIKCQILISLYMEVSIFDRRERERFYVSLSFFISACCFRV